MNPIDWPYEWSKLKERTLMKIAWHMPRKITYWCALRVMAHATTGKWSSQVVPDLLASDALKRWEPTKPVIR